MEVPKLFDDEREIQAVYAESRYYKIGVDGVTKIVVHKEYGWCEHYRWMRDTLNNCVVLDATLSKKEIVERSKDGE